MYLVGVLNKESALSRALTGSNKINPKHKMYYCIKLTLIWNENY